jgi:hypothetical protein
MYGFHDEDNKSVVAFSATTLGGYRVKEAMTNQAERCKEGKMAKSENFKALRRARLREEDAKRAIHRDLNALKHYLDKLRDTSSACRELVDAASCPQSTGPVPRLGTAFKRYVDTIASRQSILEISDDLIEQQRKLKESQDQAVRAYFSCPRRGKGANNEGQSK